MEVTIDNLNSLPSEPVLTSTEEDFDAFSLSFSPSDNEHSNNGPSDRTDPPTPPPKTRSPKLTPKGEAEVPEKKLPALSQASKTSTKVQDPLASSQSQDRDSVEEMEHTPPLSPSPKSPSKSPPNTGAAESTQYSMSQIQIQLPETKSLSITEQDAYDFQTECVQQAIVDIFAFYSDIFVTELGTFLGDIDAATADVGKLVNASVLTSSKILESRYSDMKFLKGVFTAIEGSRPELRTLLHLIENDSLPKHVKILLLQAQDLLKNEIKQQINIDPFKAVEFIQNQRITFDSDEEGEGEDQRQLWNAILHSQVRLSPDAEWREEKGKYEQTISSLRQEIILIKTQFEADESESAAEFVSQLKAKFDTLQNQLASTTAKYEEMKSKHANLESVKKEYEASASEREVVNKEADSLRQEIAELREKFRKTEEMVLEKNDEIARFTRAKEDEENEVRKQFGDDSLVGLGRVELMRNICTLRDELAYAKSFYQQASSKKENKQIKQKLKRGDWKYTFFHEEEFLTLKKQNTRESKSQRKKLRAKVDKQVDSLFVDALNECKIEFVNDPEARKNLTKPMLRNLPENHQLQQLYKLTMRSPRPQWFKENKCRVKKQVAKLVTQDGKSVWVIRPEEEQAQIRSLRRAQKKNRSGRCEVKNE